MLASDLNGDQIRDAFARILVKALEENAKESFKKKVSSKPVNAITQRPAVTVKKSAVLSFAMPLCKLYLTSFHSSAILCSHPFALFTTATDRS